jgi:hypothetical protein
MQQSTIEIRDKLLAGLDQDYNVRKQPRPHRGRRGGQRGRLPRGQSRCRPLPHDDPQDPARDHKGPGPLSAALNAVLCIEIVAEAVPVAVEDAAVLGLFSVL